MVRDVYVIKKYHKNGSSALLSQGIFTDTIQSP